jgi:hypothetical protein
MFAGEDGTECTGEIRIEVRLNGEVELTLTVTDAEGHLIERQVLTYNEESLGVEQDAGELTWAQVAAMTGEELCKTIGLGVDGDTIPGSKRKRGRRFAVAGREWWAWLVNGRLRLVGPEVTHEGLLGMEIGKYWKPKEKA